MVKAQFSFSFLFFYFYFFFFFYAFFSFSFLLLSFFLVNHTGIGISGMPTGSFLRTFSDSPDGNVTTSDSSRSFPTSVSLPFFSSFTTLLDSPSFGLPSSLGEVGGGSGEVGSYSTSSK
eukprot:Phypoly_transcript_19439.p1 GENE.Phypoly_transcript_19439~~Phypoly_transcript_19439.p1  ORF type:complete len:119 (-),score=15.22 Phypoly_transcript_19439:118-474(-)